MSISYWQNYFVNKKIALYESAILFKPEIRTDEALIMYYSHPHKCNPCTTSLS
jgi:hypothetical protein